MKDNTKLLVCSGGVDPIHNGHIEYLQKAKELFPNSKLVFLLNSDDWLIRKKGYRLQDWNTRYSILSNLKFVDYVFKVDDKDGTVVDGLKRLHNACDIKQHLFNAADPYELPYSEDFFGSKLIFCKGGDRTAHNTPEGEFCHSKDIPIIFGLGGKINSSSDIFTGALPKVQRDWGTYQVLFREPGMQIKILEIEPGKQTSVQKHSKREEYFMDLDSGMNHYSEFFINTMKTLKHVPRNEWHVLDNKNERVRRVLEVQYGEIEEDDIERKIEIIPNIEEVIKTISETPMKHHIEAGRGLLTDRKERQVQVTWPKFPNDVDPILEPKIPDYVDIVHHKV